MAENKPLSFAALCVISLLFACDPSNQKLLDSKKDPVDSELELTRSDYRNLHAPKETAPGGLMENTGSTLSHPLIPSAAPILSAPPAPKIGKAKLVSVTVTDDVPLKDVLIELSRLADVDVEIDSSIAGGINFRAKDKPFNEVIERIADLAQLRYSIKNDVLRIERDTPYIENYALDFLSMERNSSGSLTVNTSGLSSDSGGGGGDSDSGGGSGTLSTGSSTALDTAIESDFWSSLSGSIGLILQQLGPSSSQDLEDVASSQDTGSAAFVINRQAGVLSVAASARQHDIIRTYINTLRRNANAQVLLEAKIVEVDLNEEHQSGINWSALRGNNTLGVNFSPSSIIDPANSVTYGLLGTSNPNSTGGGDNLGIGLDVAVNLAEQFGTTRTLSSPRLHAINNQQAVLTFAENRVFFRLEISDDETTATDGVVVTSSPTVNSEDYRIPIGIILTMVPSINLDTGEITLNVRPTLSRQVGEVADPAAGFASSVAGQTITNTFPIIEVRELDSVMKMMSGNVMVIGGLMENTATSQENGVPGVSEIPFLGRAFKGTEKQDIKTELIIFIKATIISTDHNASNPVDKNVYHKFSNDPRPLSF